LGCNAFHRVLSYTTAFYHTRFPAGRVEAEVPDSQVAVLVRHGPLQQLGRGISVSSGIGFSTDSHQPARCPPEHRPRAGRVKAEGLALPVVSIVPSAGSKSTILQLPFGY